MKIRRYVASSVEQAIDRVKKELGRDAVILEVRRVRVPGIWGFIKRRRVEVTAALAQPVSQPSRVNTGSLSVSPLKAKKLAEVKTMSPSSSFRTDEPTQESQPLLTPYELIRKFRDRLVQRGVSSDLARLVVETALDVMSPEQMADEEILNGKIKRVIMKMFPPQRNGGTPCRISAFVGPTGVGKTTTVAKLAAIYSLQWHKKVALFTTDTFRIAAIEQLRRYASILHVPFEVIYTRQDLTDSLMRHQDADAVLIDTAGRSPKQGLHLAELRNLLAVVPDVKTSLVVSATTKAEDLDLIYDHFRLLLPSELIITKTDETKSAGAVLNLVNNSRLPVSFVSDGQNVPEDLKIASPELLTKLVWEVS